MKGMITLKYLKNIDSQCTPGSERELWHTTFLEYKLKVQYYDPKGEYEDFQSITNSKPNVADKLTYLVSLSAIFWLKELNGLMPDIVDTLSKPSIPFENYWFNLINSSIKKPQCHHFSLTFISKPLYWIDTISDILLLSSSSPKDDKVQTFGIRLSPGMAIESFKAF